MSFILNIYRGLRPGIGSLRNRLKYIVCSDPSVFSWWHTHGTSYTFPDLSYLNVPLVVVSGLMVGMGYAIYSLSDGSNEDYSQCRLHIFANILVGILMVVLWGIGIYLFLLAIVLVVLLLQFVFSLL